MALAVVSITQHPQVRSANFDISPCMYSVTEDEITNALEEVIYSGTATEYENYQKYLKACWERKDLWCLAWRHHTNNFC